MLSQPLPNIAQQKKANNCESQHVTLMRMKQNPLMKQGDDDDEIGLEFTATHKDPEFCVVLEENIRMRNAIHDAVSTLSQWIHQSRDQSENVTSLVNKMKESLQKQNSQPEDVLKAMAIQMEARESVWAAERLAFLENERVSKQMIFNLQQDNYRLRKSRMLALTPRGPSAN